MKRKKTKTCARMRIQFDAKGGRVRFVGRPGGSEQCGKKKPHVTLRGRKVNACNKKVMVEAQKFCEQALKGAAKKDTFLRKSCVTLALRQLANAAKCGG